MPLNLGNVNITDVYVGNTKIEEAYVGTNKVFSHGGQLIPATDLSVGDSIFLNENGIWCEYIIVQKGRPSVNYDISCDGIWLMRKDLFKLFELPATSIYGADNWIRNYNGFEVDNECVAFYNSNLFLYSNVILNSVIPSRTGSGSAGDWRQVNSTLQRKCFALSAGEMGFQNSANVWSYPTTAKLSYFGYGSTVDNDKRKAYYNGSLYDWATRTTNYIEDYDAGTNELDGILTNTLGWFSGVNMGYNSSPRNVGLRPCVIISNGSNVTQETHYLQTTL